MRCQRCGFEMEEGQTFCSMCGTEQSRAIRKKKKTPKSILWVIKVASKSHLKLWLIFLASLVLSILTLLLMDTSSPVVISSLCLSVILLAYELIYILIGYKNPNSTKTKSYKLKYRTCLAAAIILFLFTVFLDFGSLTTNLHEFITKFR